jgi:hypothetical protein
MEAREAGGRMVLGMGENEMGVISCGVDVAVVVFGCYHDMT